MTDQRDREAGMAIAPYHRRRHSHMDAPTPARILAAFAANLAIHLAVFATILPPLPPITQNVTLPRAANPLEFAVRMRDDADHKTKSGKNGNVHHPSQHYRLEMRPNMTEVTQ